MLQQIANRIQRDSRSCEDKLILARNALQSVSQSLTLLVCLHELAVVGWLLQNKKSTGFLSAYLITDTFIFAVLLSLVYYFYKKISKSTLNGFC